MLTILKNPQQQEEFSMEHFLSNGRYSIDLKQNKENGQTQKEVGVTYYCWLTRPN